MADQETIGGGGGRGAGDRVEDQIGQIGVCGA